MPLSIDFQKIDHPNIFGYRAQVLATAYGKAEDKPVAITPECTTLSQLEREVTRLQEELRGLLETARTRFTSPIGGPS